MWERSEDEGGEGFGGPSKAFALKRTLRHSDVVSAAVLEKGGDFALSCSWDRTVKLWKLDEEDEDPCLRTMRGHKHQVNAVVWSPDVRVIVTASCDKQLKIWNNLGECKFSLQYNDGHEDWVSAVAYGDECLLSAGWDRTVKLWNTKAGSPGRRGHSRHLKTWIDLVRSGNYRQNMFFRLSFSFLSRTLVLSRAVRTSAWSGR